MLSHPNNRSDIRFWAKSVLWMLDASSHGGQLALRGNELSYRQTQTCKVTKVVGQWGPESISKSQSIRLTDRLTRSSFLRDRYDDSI